MELCVLVVDVAHERELDHFTEDKPKYYQDSSSSLITGTTSFIIGKQTANALSSACKEMTSGISYFPYSPI